MCTSAAWPGPVCPNPVCVLCVCGNQPLVGQHRGVVCCWHASGVASWPPSQAQHPGRDQGRVPHAALLPCRSSCPLAAAPWILLPFPTSRGLAVVRKVTSSSNATAGCTATQAVTPFGHATHPTHATCACGGASCCGSPCRGGSGNYLSQVKRPKAYSLPASIPHLLSRLPAPGFWKEGNAQTLVLLNCHPDSGFLPGCPHGPVLQACASAGMCLSAGWCAALCVSRPVAGVLWSSVNCVCVSEVLCVGCAAVFDLGAVSLRVPPAAGAARGASALS